MHAFFGKCILCGATNACVDGSAMTHVWPTKIEMHFNALRPSKKMRWVRLERTRLLFGNGRVLWIEMIQQQMEGIEIEIVGGMRIAFRQKPKRKKNNRKSPRSSSVCISLIESTVYYFRHAHQIPRAPLRAQTNGKPGYVFVCVRAFFIGGSQAQLNALCSALISINYN